MRYEIVEVGRPDNDDKEAWKIFWKSRKQPWRTEPRISAERQNYLAERRSIAPYTIPNLFPFKDIKLSRADVEWLLATHEDGRGPIDWKDEKQREREGIDLRGADLRGVDLSELPMVGLVGGLRQGDDALVLYDHLQKFEVEIAGIHLEGAHLEMANLIEASLGVSHVERANLPLANLAKLFLIQAHLGGADLRGANLKGADLKGSHLEGVDLSDAHLEGADLRTVHLAGANLSDAHLEGANLKGVHLEGVDL